MNESDFKRLQAGDIIQDCRGTTRYLVSANYGDRIDAVILTELHNNHNWIKVTGPADYCPPPPACDAGPAPCPPTWEDEFKQMTIIEVLVEMRQLLKRAIEKLGD